MSTFFILVGLFFQPNCPMVSGIELQSKTNLERVYLTLNQGKVFITVESDSLELASVSIYSPSGLLLFSKPEQKVLTETKIIEITEKGSYWVFFKENSRSHSLRLLVPFNKDI